MKRMLIDTALLSDWKCGGLRSLKEALAQPWSMRGGTKWRGRGRMYNLDREGCSRWKEPHIQMPGSMHSWNAAEASTAGMGAGDKFKAGLRYSGCLTPLGHLPLW